MAYLNGIMPNFDGSDSHVCELSVRKDWEQTSHRTLHSSFEKVQLPVRLIPAE